MKLCVGTNQTWHGQSEACRTATLAIRNVASAPAQRRLFHRFQESGSALLSTIVFGSILLVISASLLALASARFKSAQERWDWNESYFHTENAIQWAGQQIADSAAGGSGASFLGKYSAQNATLSLNYLAGLSSGSTLFSNTWLTIENDPGGANNLYRATASALVGKKLRTIQARIRKGAPSYVFDYEYFLNNWGWWWGSTITGNGDNRANWDFDFR